MACSLAKIKRDSLNHIRGIFKKGTKSVTITPKGDASIKYKTISTAEKLAATRIARINEWSKEKFKTDEYANQWTKVHKSPKDVRVELVFPAGLESRYIAQMDEQNARATQQTDAARAGIEYEDDYMYMANSIATGTVTPDGYNYGVYTDHKTRIRNYINRRINILTQTPNRTKKDNEQIEELRNVARRLTKDITMLQSTSPILKNFFNFFNNDLKIIDEMLMENPTIHNLMAAREFLDTMAFVYAKSNIEGHFSKTFYDNLVGEDKQMFKDFVGKITNLEKKLDEKELDVLAVQIAIQNKITNKEQLTEQQETELNELKALISNVKDMSWISAAIVSIDGDSEQSPLLKFIRKTYDDAVGKEETYELRQALNNLKPAVEKILTKLGHISNNSILGTLYSNVNYKLFKRKTSSNRHRLAGKFNDKWEAVQKEVAKKYRAIDAIVYKSNKDIQDYAKIKDMRREMFRYLKKNNIQHIDIRSIPELINHPDLQKFQPYFKSSEEAEDYKEEVIQSLMDGSTEENRASAERIYDGLVKQQIEKAIAFDISMEQYKTRLLRAHNANTITELDEKVRNKFLETYYIDSPFAFSGETERTGNSEVTKIYYQNAVRKEATAPSTMKYNVFVPSGKEYIDKEFVEQIEGNPTLYKAWDLMDQLTAFTNTNKNYDERGDTNNTLNDSLTQSVKMVQKHLDSNFKMLKYFSQNALDNFKSMISTTKFKDISKDLKLNGSIVTINEAIDRVSRPILAVARAENVSMSAKYTMDTVPKRTKKLIQGKLDNAPTEFTIPEIVDLVAEKEVMDKQELDLIDTISSQVEQVQKLKASKEIENVLLFARNQLKKVDKTQDSSERARTIKMANNFITKQLYGVNNRKNWNNHRQDESGWKTYSTQDKEMIASIDASIQMLQDLIPGIVDQKRQNQAIDDMNDLKAFKDNIGRVTTAGSVFEALAVQMSIIVGLGLNVPSQIVNWYIGDLSGRANDGLEWESGAYYVAASESRKWKIANRKINKGLKKKYKLRNTLISSLGIFQNSANEGGDRIAETNIKEAGKGYLRSWMALVGAVEKTIQRPQILAKMTTVKITSADGTSTVPLFDHKNSENSHPAFELDEAGNLALKEEFNTKENRDTWIHRNSQQYADLFGESGVFPKLISKINGDYRNSSVTGIKDTSVGVLAMMFKNWMSAYIMRRYGKTEGVYTKLGDSGRKGKTITAVALTGGLLALATGPYIALGGAILTAGYLGFRKNKELIAQEGNYAKALASEIASVFRNAQFLTDTIGMTAGAGVKLIQQTSDIVLGNKQQKIFGDRLISDEFVSKVAMIKQKEGESDEEFAKNKARINFMLTELASVAAMLGMRVLAGILLYPDDDDDEQYKKKGLKDKFLDHPDIMLYYAIENLSTRLIEDATLAQDPGNMTEMILSGSSSSTFDKAASLFGSIETQARDGNYQAGPNAGRNRIWMTVGKTFIPRGVQGTFMNGELPTLGFNNLVKEDYIVHDPITRMLESDEDTYTRKRKEARTNRKFELREIVAKKHKTWDEDKVEKRVQAQLKREFPTISRNFKPSGEVKASKKRKLEKKYD